MAIPSLPGRHGTGDLGPEADWFVEFLADAGQRWWQILPLSPMGMENSPYNALSAFAGNPLFISLELLAEEDLLAPEDVEPCLLPGAVDYAAGWEFKRPLLRKAFEDFEGRRGFDEPGARDFAGKERFWLDDYALYAAIRESRGGAGWTSWPPEIRSRDAAALDGARRTLSREIRYQRFLQLKFWEQWERLSAHARRRGVGIIGDVPFFVAHESADVWAHPELFSLDGEGRPLEVAGVPPDFFSADGQLWGNPLYRWEVHAARGFEWWTSRLRSMLRRFAATRLDHFIGFHRVWAVPASARTAREGKFLISPGAEVLRKIEDGRGPLPFIAEDLGLVTPEVEQLRGSLDLPTMRVLQFGFAKDGDCPFHQPHTAPRRCAVYTGTHDNDTVVGWFRGLGDGAKRVLEYLGSDGADIHWTLIEAVARSPADLAIVPLQDFLGLGSEARMNRPGVIEGNWRWRLPEGAITDELAERIRGLSEAHGRLLPVAVAVR
jgi:4-alpha-glucanotransferase